jgi:hypothetical protein
MFLTKLNLVEPPGTGPVCPVVWEGWHREVSPYPDLRPKADFRFSSESEKEGHSAVRADGASEPCLTPDRPGGNSIVNI